MTPEEAYRHACSELGYNPKLRIAYEYENVFGFRLRPGELLCVVKKTGEVAWEEELSGDLVPDGVGKMHILMSSKTNNL